MTEVIASRERGMAKYKFGRKTKTRPLTVSPPLLPTLVTQIAARPPTPHGKGCRGGSGVFSVEANADRRLHLAQAVQRLMAEILLAHDSSARFATADSRGDSEQNFPWRLNPPGARACYAAAINGLAPSPRWRYGRVLLLAFTHYLCRLQWLLELPTRYHSRGACDCYARPQVTSCSSAW